MDGPNARDGVCLPAGDLWVFGYGSLMWNPGFEHVDRRNALLHGYHRSLCVWSWFHRGTPRAPGLVLGLDRGGSCTGVAFRIPASAKHGVAAYLYERELVTEVYEPVVREVRLEDRLRVAALAFRVRRDHPQYAGRVAPEVAAAVVRSARGRGGRNEDYVRSTAETLDRLGIPCQRLAAVCRHLPEH